ncbi:branched-chain amino acid transport system II carrier protein [Staphylococcus aureus]
MVLFFGAGNLIFPIHCAERAGLACAFIANLGFLITAIGLPFAGIYFNCIFKNIRFI